MEIKIPNLGDVDEVEVIELCIAVGDHVEVGDTLIVIESDKASMDVPSTSAGVVASIKVSLGDQVGEGTVIVVLADEDGAAGQSNDDQKDKERDKESDSEAKYDKEVDTDSETSGNAANQSDGSRGADEQSVDSQSAEKISSETSEVEVLVPDIGDSDEVVVIEVAVKAGDQVEENDLLVVLESDKASMEIAAEENGTIVSVAVSEGDNVAQGTLIATLEVTGATPTEDKKTPTLKDNSESKAPGSDKPSLGADNSPAQGNASADDSADEKSASNKKVYAGPAVRRLARELGVDLSAVKGTGARDRIVKDDVKAFVKTQLNQPRSGGGLPEVAKIDFEKFGEVELSPLTRIQQVGADNLHRSWVNLPHVTQHDEVDITDLEAFRKSLKSEAERKDVRVTPLAFLVKACCHALTEYPIFNSSLHEDRKQIIVKKFVNVGMAVDTPEGLVVPVIRDADKKSIWQLSADIAELSDKARNKKLGINDLQGGTFSISSLGQLGGTGFTPIVNAPEVAILGVANMQTKPLWDGEAFQPRKVLPLSLSYDHRVINGADGGRFMVFLTSVLADIRRLAL